MALFDRDSCGTFAQIWRTVSIASSQSGFLHAVILLTLERYSSSSDRLSKSRVPSRHSRMAPVFCRIEPQLSEKVPTDCWYGSWSVGDTDEDRSTTHLYKHPDSPRSSPKHGVTTTVPFSRQQLDLSTSFDFARPSAFARCMRLLASFIFTL